MVCYLYLIYSLTDLKTIFAEIILYIKRTIIIYVLTGKMKKSDGIPLKKPGRFFSSAAADVMVEQRALGGNVILPYPLYPHAVEFARRTTSHWFRTEYGVHLMIIYIPEGKIRYRYENRSVILEKNKVLVIPPGKAFRFETVEGCVYRKNVLFVNGINLPSVADTLGFDRISLLKLPDLTVPEDIFHAIYESMEQNTGDLPFLTGKTLELLQYLSGFVEQQESSPLLFKLIQSYIGNNFSREFELKTLAEEFRVSERTINRLFHKHLGVTPAQYRRECRFNAACELLRQNDLSIKEIADHLGYCNQFHFSKEFTRLAGVAPRLWRRKQSQGE